MDKKPLFIISLGSILVIVGIILTVRMNGIQGSKEVGRNRMSTSIKENKRSSKTTEEWSVETGPHNTVSNAKGTILKINLEESKILVEVEKSDIRFSSKELSNITNGKKSDESSGSKKIKLIRVKNGMVLTIPFLTWRDSIIITSRNKISRGAFVVKTSRLCSNVGDRFKFCVNLIQKIRLSA